jgi:hypothetical protein
MIRNLPAVLLLAAVGTTATAQTVEFTFPVTGESGLTTRTFTDATTGLQLTIDNPRDNTLFSNNTFGFTLGGLFIDGGLAPTLDWTFSEDVRLVEYTIANQDNTDLFTLTQGGTVSANNTTDPIGTFAFTNASDIFAGSAPITLTTSDHSGGGYSISRIVVELAGPSLIGDDYIAHIDVGGSPASTVNDTALLGPDTIGNWFGQIGYDVEARSITVNSLLPNTGPSWAGGITWTFSDLDFLPPGFKIIGANVTNAAGAGWSSIDNSNISFTDDSVSINASDIGGAFTALDQTVTVELLVGPNTSLIGDDYIANLYFSGFLSQSQPDTALAGPDLVGNWSGDGAFIYDVEDDTITVTSVITCCFWAPLLQFEFLDLDFNQPGVEIIGATVINATGAGFSSLSDANLSVTSNSLLIDASSVAGIVPALDQSITVKLITAPSNNFIGDDYIANYYYFGGLQQIRNDTALVGPDAIGNFQSIINYNIEPDNTLKINSTATSGGWVQGQMWEFLNLDVNGGGSIVDVIVIDATGNGWSNIDNSDISFTANSILVDAADIVGITPALNQSVTLQIITSNDPACTGDIADDFGTLGADDQVSFGDFLALLGLIGSCPGGTPGCTGDIADDFGTIGGDGQVSFGDFLALLGLIGPCP